MAIHECDIDHAKASYCCPGLEAKVVEGPQTVVSAHDLFGDVVPQENGCARINIRHRKKVSLGLFFRSVTVNMSALLTGARLILLLKIRDG